MTIEVLAFKVADKILGRLIAQEPYSKRAVQKMFPAEDYKKRLIKCINKTIDEYEKKHKTVFPPKKFPFYHSQILFDLLTQYMLFDEGSVELIKEEFEKNPNIIPPREEELKEFYGFFIEKVNADDGLKKLFIDENYKEKIFENASKLDKVIITLAAIQSDTKIILEKLEKSKPHRDPSKELTARLPLILTDKIVKRDDDLTDIRNRLLKNKRVLVHSMGGIGKTTLAQLYLTNYYDNYKHLIWIAISSDDFIADFTQTPGLGESLNVTLEDKTPQQYFDALIIAIKSLPHTADEQSLMVIDNAEENLVKYRSFLPNPPQWHILTTSRIKLEDFDVKELEFLNEEQSVKLFKIHYKRKKISDEEIKEIVKTLEYHTLTIEILAKTAQRDGLDVQKTVNSIAEDYEVDVNTRHAFGKIDKITSYLSSIFDMSKLSSEEIWLLKQFCYLPPQFHTYQTLETLLQSAIEEKQINLQRILTKLATKGWLLFNETTDEYRLHRIIAEVIKKSAEISFDDISPLLNSISLLLKIDQTKDNPVDKFQWVTFGKYFLAQLPVSEDNSSVSILQNNLALILSDLGDYKGAKDLLEKAMASHEKNFGKEHPATAVSYSNLASVIRDLGDYKGAKDLLEKAMALDEKNFGKEHPTTVISYSNLATVLHDLGDYKGAKDLLEKAVISNEKNFGKEHPTTAVSYSNLASVIRDLGDYKGAKDLLEKALASDEKNFGKEHPTTAKSYSNLATVLRALGDFNRAKELFEKAMKSDEKNFGKEHPATAVSYSNLATVLQDLGDYHGAKVLLEKTVVSDEKNFGKEHPATAVSYSNLATVLRNLGDYKGAKNLLEKAVAQDEKNFGKEHPTTAIRYSNLATVLHDLGEYNKAKDLLEKAILILDDSLGKQHPNTLEVKLNLIILHLKILTDEMQKKNLL